MAKGRDIGDGFGELDGTDDLVIGCGEFLCVFRRDLNGIRD